MRGFGAEVVEFGVDFDEARSTARRVAASAGCNSCPRFTATW